MIMSDVLRKTDNLIRVGTIVDVDLSSAPAMVRVEVDEGVRSDWMPFSQSFVGETMIWCAPKIGTSGLVVSEGGENRVNRFFPCFNDESNAPGLSSNDFKIFLKNGDSIHHDSGSGTLTINSSNQVVVNSETADVNAPNITLNGNVTVTQSFTVLGFSSLNGGFAMNPSSMKSRSTATGTINIPVSFVVDPTIMGRKFLDHKHKGVLSGGDDTKEVS